jgi:hypothetical protein
MQISRCVLALALALTAACGREASPVAAPDQPSLSTWTRTYYISGMTYQGSRFNIYPASYVGGYVKVELVPDNPLMGAYELGRVDADGDAASFYKPADNAVRLTAVPTVAGCTFRRWSFPGSGTSTTVSSNPVNMDNYHPFYQVQGEFLCP